MAKKAGQFTTSRRTVLQSLAWAAALGGTGTLFGDQTAKAQQQKVSKELAKYQDEPKGEQKCADCQFFVEPNVCTTVEGDISPEGWCQLWVAKA
jgi:hypothetical protein